RLAEVDHAAGDGHGGAAVDLHRVALDLQRTLGRDLDLRGADLDLHVRLDLDRFLGRDVVCAVELARVARLTPRPPGADGLPDRSVLDLHDHLAVVAAD